MCKTPILCIYIISFLCLPCITDAMATNASTSPEMTTNILESSFTVTNKTITPGKSDIETCKTDNAYMLSAFKENHITFTTHDYSVNVSKKIYSRQSINSDDDLELFHYEVKFDNFNDVITKIAPDLAQKNFITTYIPLSKAPTQCYAFIATHKLNLMCHYGFKQHPAMPGIISTLKKTGDLK